MTAPRLTIEIRPSSRAERDRLAAALDALRARVGARYNGEAIAALLRGDPAAVAALRSVAPEVGT